MAASSHCKHLINHIPNTESHTSNSIENIIYTESIRQNEVQYCVAFGCRVFTHAKL